MPSKRDEVPLRLAALAGIVGGVLWGAKAGLDGIAPASWIADLMDALYFLAPLLMLVGLVGVHARYSSQIMGMGRTGFVNCFIGLALLIVGFASGLSFGVEEAMRISSFGFLILAFGLVLLGLEVLKAAALPRWNFLPLAMGLLVPLSVISGDAVLLRAPLSVLFGLGWVLLGLVLLSDAADAE
jgi:hypothetical protein